MNTRRLVCLSLAVLLSVLVGYLIAPNKHPSRKFQVPAAAGPGRYFNPSSTQPDETIVNDTNATRKAEAELRQSEFCTNHCNSSEIYGRLWYTGRIRENARMFQGSDDDVDVDDPYRESIETNVVTKDFRLVIKVLAFNRLESLSRCLLSLAKADYGGDNVNIQIFIDHFRYDEIRRNESSENSSDVSSDSMEEPSTTSVEGKVKRLLWGLFKRDQPVMQDNVPIVANPADVPAFDTGNEDEVNDEREAGQEAGQEMVDRLMKGPKEQGDGPAKSPVGVQHEGQRDLNDDLVRRTLEMKSLDEQLEDAHEILKFVDNFWWSHGTKEIHYRSQNVGLQTQWIESWWPADLDEFAFIVEDDMELSKLYYRFLRTVIATYYYNPEQYDPSVYGVSLQRPRFVPGKGGLPLHVNSTKNLFMYPLVGTWGQLLFPRQWKEFRLWYDKHKSKGERPILEGMVTNSWYKKLGERIWTPWFVKFTHSRGYFNLYTNFFEERALSVSHRELGSNYRKAVGPDSRLIDSKREGNDTMLWVMSPSKSLPQFDFCFRDVKIWELARALPELSPMLASMEVKNSVLLVNLIDVHSTLVRNWLCLMERLGLRKFVLLGDDNELTVDLARRGYATVSTEVFTAVETAGSRLRRDMIAAQAVHEILSLGYSVWLTRADTVWVHNPFDTVVDTQVDIMGSQPLDSFHPALLYIQASQSSVWSKWVGNMSVIARDVSRRHSSVWLGFQDFITSNKNCRYEPLPRSLSGHFRDLGSNTIASGKKVILLNGLQGRNLPLVVHTLKAAGLWTIDQDLACTRVYC